MSAETYRYTSPAFHVKQCRAGGWSTEVHAAILAILGGLVIVAAGLISAPAKMHEPGVTHWRPASVAENRAHTDELLQGQIDWAAWLAAHGEDVRWAEVAR